MPHLKSINTMEVGTEGIIIKVSGSDSFRRKLMEIGFISGTSIYCVSINKLLDSMTFRVRGATISLRISEAFNVKLL